MNAHAPTLDIDKFNKVHALMKGGATAGERSAAKSRAEAIAAKAGMSLKQAIAASKPARTSGRSSGRTWADQAREAAEANERAQAAQRRAEEEKLARIFAEEARRQQARFDNAVRAHGPHEAAMAERQDEAGLRVGLDFIATYQTVELENGEKTLEVDGFIGWKRYGAASDAFVTIMGRVIPVPTSLAGVAEEWRKWEALRDLRAAYWSDYEFPPHVAARVDVLEALLDRRAVESWDDLEARLWWMRETENQMRWSTSETRCASLDRLSADLDILRASRPMQSDIPGHAEARAQNGHAQFERRTNAAKAGAVKDLLQSSPELSNREIGRRIGVSPQTVANWRERIA